MDFSDRSQFVIHIDLEASDKCCNGYGETSTLEGAKHQGKQVRLVSQLEITKTMQIYQKLIPSNLDACNSKHFVQ